LIQNNSIKSEIMRNILRAFFILFLFSHAALAQSVNGKFIAEKQLYYGAAYYPEAWGKDEIKRDIVHMKDLRMNVMRMAEFSWALMEPEEGKYEFGWLHDIIDELYSNGIRVILGTPTATPPVWMATKYPEIFVIDEQGLRKEHGARRNCRYTSNIYQRKSVEICESMAREFGRKPGVIGWQTDNEFGLSIDYSEETNILWHQWLEDKYKTVGRLNDLWKLNLWSQKYQRFDQVPMPKSNIWHHPSLRLDWVKFSEDQLIHYQDLQLAAIRKYSDLPITHDGMPGQQIDYPRLFDNLDFATTNVYHSFQVYNRVQGNYDRIRGYGKGMHWLFETAPNHSGGGPQGNTWFIHQPNGAMRAAIWMNYAMGGQGSLFWLWRQQPAGQEMPHGAILSAWGAPAANYDDLKQLGAEIHKMSNLLMDHPVAKADMAIVYEHESDKVFRIEEISNDIKYYTTWTENFYTPISDAFIHRDVISMNSPIDQYKLIFVPLTPIIHEAEKNKLKRWVEHGGTLILGPMSGYRNEYFGANTDYALGNLEPWMGINVKSRLPIDPITRNFDHNLEIVFDPSFQTPAGIAALWSDALTSEKGKIIARYQYGMHHHQAAIIENKVGNGKVVLLGSYPGPQAMKQLVLHYAKEKGIEPLATGDTEVLVVPRTNAENKYLFVINLKNEMRNINLPCNQWQDMLSGATQNTGSLSLKPYEVRLISEIGALKSDKR
jgi:beta-galactosidase